MIIKKFLVLFSLLLAIISVLTLKVNAEENNNSFNFFNVNYDYSKNCYHTTIDNYDNLENAADFKNNKNLPKQVDLSQNECFPPIGEQKGGSCASWATTYYQLTYEMNKLNNTAANIPQNICSPVYTFNYLNNGDFESVIFFV